MGPFGWLSTIDRAQTFLVNQNHLSKDNYSYIKPAFRGRKIFHKQIKLNYIEYRYFHLYHKMGPFGWLSTIDRAQTFLVNQNHLSKDIYSYIKPAFRGRQVFQETNKNSIT